MRKTKSIINTACWLLIITAGFVVLLRYEAGAGPTTRVSDWPQASRLQPGPKPYTLLVFLHPQCPCSNATVTELAKVMAGSDNISARALFIRPAVFQPGWENTNLWKRVEGIPGVVATVDEEGRECELFGVKTSGECALFDQNRNLLFSGGITASRGHEGDNQGSAIVASLVSNSNLETQNDPLRTQTFGCPLFGCTAQTIKANLPEDTE